MSYPLGTKIGAPLTNGSEQAQFGTHISYLGVGGYREVATLVDRDAIPVKGAVEYDGASSGMRRAGMLVYVVAEQKTYRLDIPGYAAMSDLDKLAALTSNSYWLEVEFGIGGAQGNTVQDFVYDPSTYTLTLTTDRSTKSVDLSSLDVASGGTTITTINLTSDNTLAINLSDGSQRTVSLATLAVDRDTKVVDMLLNSSNLVVTMSDGSTVLADLSDLKVPVNDANYAKLDQANVFTQAQTISSGSTSLLLRPDLVEIGEVNPDGSSNYLD